MVFFLFFLCSFGISYNVSQNCAIKTLIPSHLNNLLNLILLLSNILVLWFISSAPGDREDGSLTGSVEGCSHMNRKHCTATVCKEEK